MSQQPMNITIHQTSTGFALLPGLLEHRAACVDQGHDMQTVALAALEELRAYKRDPQSRDDLAYKIQINDEVFHVLGGEMPDQVRTLFDWVMQHGAKIEAGQSADCEERSL